MTIWTFEATPIDRPDAVALLRAYRAELISRYHRRPATEAEVDQLGEWEPDTGLAAFLVARRHGLPVGCVGLRRLTPALGELTKVYLDPAARGQGGGARLITAIEAAAAELGMTTVRLDTRADLVEARALYARQGYREIPRYNDSAFSDHWFEKSLPARTTPPTAS
ncbi:GNAT superfamily N-acetyltransferase [Kitasatospora sp. GAS204A]|uniref:GNAT family N-acetyltransferase n=1 Tax=unclassified Kitasatospora TaxID=2633591 RepID=UPI0024766A5F|nr:GNAT family N-acetyltransferase [Kitasatospora sp. GAS204B]MDH6121301.1 GNAT superfamily N-acetyltransferase [Kitasatospora sp. GAS204B]